MSRKHVEKQYGNNDNISGVFYGGSRESLEKSRPDTSWGAEELEVYNKEIFDMLWKKSYSFMNNKLLPKGDAIATGVYIYGSNVGCCVEASP